MDFYHFFFNLEQQILTKGFSGTTNKNISNTNNWNIYLFSMETIFFSLTNIWSKIDNGNNKKDKIEFFMNQNFGLDIFILVKFFISSKVLFKILFQVRLYL